MSKSRLTIALPLLLWGLLAGGAAHAALEADSVETTNACAQLGKIKASGKSLTAVDPSTQETVDSPAYASLISACNKNAQMCAPTKQQLGAGAPPGLACLSQAMDTRRCLVTLTLLAQVACGASTPKRQTDLSPPQTGISAGSTPSN